jgi:hypothetical protein
MAETRRTDYERSDMTLSAIAVAALAVVALLAMGPLALRLFYTGLPNDADRQPAIAPPPPRLQTDPAADLRQFRAEEDRRLNSYGWIDRERGIVHIPIAEAMKRAAAQGIDGFPRSAP